jgi:uncharacterized membrane protein YtjA (UPF0391 family)
MAARSGRSYSEAMPDATTRSLTAPVEPISIQEPPMLHYAVVFFVIALIAAVFGFGGIAASAAGIAKILFVVFAVMALVSFVFGLMKR